jgi:hypothetical protein
MEVRMLEDFVVTHRDEIITNCRSKVAKRSDPPPTPAEIDHGVPMFLDELIAELRDGLSANPDISKTAARQGHDMLLQGYTPSQVVHNYGDVCQAITEMAIEKQAPISTDDFRMLNRCLDDAIAAAITQYGDERDSTASSKSACEGDRVRVLGDGLRASVRAARVAFDAIKSGKVGIGGSTGAVLDRCLTSIEDLNERRAQVELAGVAENGRHELVQK